MNADRWLAPLALLALLATASAAAGPADDSFLDLGQARARQKSAAEAVFVEDRLHVSVVELAGNYDKLLADGTPNVEPRQTVARAFYEAHGDEYDFLLVFTTFEFETGDDVQAFYTGVRNEVLGIGRPIFDSSGLYGSAGRLQGYVDMAAVTRYELDPLAPQFDFTLATAAHEIMHRWGIVIDGPLGDRLLHSDRAHWGFLVDTDASLMYGNDWRDNGDGTFTSAGIRTFYNPVELYLAGFYAPEEVPAFLVVDDPTVDPDKRPELGAVVEGPVEIVTIDDVVAANGPRIPPAAESQHLFRAAVLLLKGPGEDVDDEVLDALEKVRESLMARFPILTGGRGLIEVEPQVIAGTATGSPAPVAGGDPRADAASLADALAWLAAEQGADGTWQDTPATRPRDTNAAVTVLDAFDPSFAGAGAALAWLAAEPNANTDFLARAVATLERFGADATAQRAALTALRNADGGWGLGPKLDSNPLDTALAAAALGAQGTELDAAAYLLATQNADGGWGNHAGGSSRTVVTTAVARVLAERPGVPPEALAAATAWLAGQQNGDGGFGDSPSTPHDTANVLLALLRLNAADAVNRGAAVSYLRGRQTEDGSWAGSRYATALAVDALKRVEELPNYSFAAPLTADPAAPRDGERVRLSATVANSGGDPTPPGLLRFYDGDEPFAEVELPPLARRATATVVAHWESFDRPGPRTLAAVLDPDGAAEELSETDNRATLLIEVSAAPEGVDLAVGPADVTASPAAPAEIPSTVALSAIVRNLGKTDAGTVTVALWLGDAAAGTLLDTTEVVLPQRSSTAANFTYTLTAPGTTFFTVELDPDGAVAEDDEDNNRAAAAVTTRPTIDLEVTADDLVLDGAAFLGLDASFRVTVRNRGTLDAPAIAVRLEVVDGAASSLVQVASVTLGPGASQELAVPWRVDRLGELLFRATVDPDGFLVESDEANNAAELAFTASELAGWNLSVSHEEMSLVPDPGLQGAPVTLGAVVRNGSDVALADVEVAFYDGDPDDGGVLVGEVLTVSLAAGEAREISVTTEAILVEGDRVYFVVVDPQGLVDELEEADNRAFRALKVLSLPDLALSASAISVAPAAPEPGAAAAVTVTVANLGGQTARDVVVRLTDSVSAQTLEQVLPFVDPGSSATASFAWTFPETSATVALSAAADPGGAIAELRESNNAAERFVQPAARDSELLSHRYFSPNGDGVRDTTAFLFSLPAPADARIEVVDARDAARRAGPELAGVTEGSFEWDGRDDLGAVVDDGDYRIRALDVFGGVLAEAVVTVDTNRLPLFDAFNTPYEITTNVTCDFALESDHDFALPPPYDTAFFRKGFWAYGMPLGGEPRKLLTGSRLVVSDDGEKIATGRLTANADGSGVVEFTDAGDSFGFRPGTHDLVWIHDNSHIAVQPLDGSPRRILAHESSDFARDVDSRYHFNTFSGDGRWLFLHGNDWLQRAVRHEGVDLETGDVEYLGLETGTWAYSWNPTSTLLARIANASFLGLKPLDVDFWAPTGDHPRISDSFFDLPREPISELDGYSYREWPAPGTVSFSWITTPSWSSDGNEFIFGVTYIEESSEGQEVEFGRLLRYDLKSAVKETIGYLRPFGPNNSFTVSTWDGGGWVERGVLHYDNFYSEETLDLSGVLPDADGEYKVRIRQSGLDAAHVEKVLLYAGRGGNAREARAVSASLVAGGDVLPLVVRHDRDVLDLHGKEMEARFTDPFAGFGEGAAETPLTLALIAREEDFSALETRPFSYPAEPERVYEVLVDGRGGLVVDGLQTGDDLLGAELFSVMTRPGTGHPAARVYGYAASDGDNLYAALDFTVDNTRDGERDWGELQVLTDGGWRPLRVTETDSTWGRVGFARTGKVHHVHKYYEFQVPLAEIGAAVGDVVELRFRAYGTAAEALPEKFFLPRRGEYPTWIPGTRKVLYSGQFEGTNWVVHMDDGNRVEQVLGEFTSLSEPFFLDGGRKLIFRDSRDILDPLHECYNPQGEFSFFVMESAANLAARLEAVPVDDGLSFDLQGTVADRNFKSYLLEYASEDLPGFWTPIGGAETAQVFDGLLTTWTPPHSGWFQVRLTAEDLAGNVTRTTRRISYGVLGNAPISNLAVTPRFISPNGDGTSDAATISYRVQEPIHLEVKVFDERNERVRTFTRDHSAVGEEHAVVWDGRGEDGLPVADGVYRVEVLRYKLQVTVDTRPPAGAAPRLTPALATDLDGLIVVEPRLVWCALDSNPHSGVLEVGEGAEPQLWSEVGALSVGGLCPGAENARRLTLEQVVDRRYRVRARDAAGNEGLLTGGLAEPELIVDRVAVDGGDPNRLAPDGFGLPAASEQIQSLLLSVTETSRSPLGEVWIQFRSASDGPWQEVPANELFERGGLVPQASVPRLRFDLRWSEVPLALGTWEVRLRARDEDGGEHFSNAFFVSNEIGLVHGGVVDGDALASARGSDLEQALDQAGLDPEEVVVLWAYNLRPDPLIDVSMRITSLDDPRFAGGQTYLPAGESGGVYVFAPDSLEACLSYASVASGRALLSGAPLTTPESSLRLPCLDLGLVARRGATGACGEPVSSAVTVELVGRSLDDEDLQLLTLALDDPLNVVANVNRPVSGLTYTVDLDGGDLAEGYHLLTARLLNTAGQELVQSAPLVVDATPPAIELTHPTNDATVCAAGPDAALNGTISDLGGLLEYRVFFRAAAGAVWQPYDTGPGHEAPRQGALQEREVTGHLSDLGKLFAEVEGEVALRVEAEDLGGNVSCDEISFTVDERSAVSALVLPRTFSPDGDGVLDEIQLTLTALEPATVDAEVFAAGLEGQGDAQVLVPVGPVLARPVAGLQVFDHASVVWDGRGSEGDVLADGSYLMTVRSRDACGNESVSQRRVRIDTEAPLVDLAAPPPGAQLDGLVVDLVGWVEDALLAGYRVDAGAGTDPTTWSLAAEGSLPRRNELLGQWTTFGLTGTYTLRLRARDEAGNAAEVLNTVELTGAGDVLNALEAVPAVISPNGDGRQETAAIRFGLLRDAEVTLEILHGGAVVATLAAAEPRPAGSAIVVWDGRDSFGQPAADGAYEARLLAVDAASGDSQEESVTVTVDATPPAVSVTRPTAFASGTGPVLGSVLDPRLDGYRVSLAGSEIGQGGAAVDDGILASFEGLAEGEHVLSVEAFDTAQNRTEVRATFTVDNQPPRPRLDAPAAGDLLAAAQGAVTVRGAVEEENPLSYRLEAGAGESPATWTELAAGTGLPGAALAAWDLTGLADGPHTLRLSATDRGGLSAAVTVAVTIDNSPPVAAIAEPVDGAYLKAPVEVRGTATDAASFDHYRLELAPGPAATAGAWAELAQLGTPVTGGALLDWQVQVPDGVYTLRLTTADRAGNTAEAHVEVTVDRTPPAPPTGVEAAPSTVNESVLVWWDESPEPDLERYKVYRDGTAVGGALPPSTGFSDSSAPDATFVYTVTAVDEAGNESAPSEPVTISIDRTPPAAVLHTPRDGDHVGGLVEVRLTATSDDDFGEYRLLLLDGTADGELLRGSPVPAQSLPVPWDTSALADGPAVLRLEAEDVHGNLATAEAAVTIDNTPPAVPAGLAATASGDDVSLSWDANAEDDLLGYLLYRQGQLVNAHGGVDDLRDFALADPAYADLDRGDGTLVYRVAAIDRAGNPSALSEPAEVTLETGAPHAILAEPAEGAATDGDLYVLAVSDDLDVARVDFEHRAAGDTAWTALGGDAEEPFDAQWRPDVLGLPYGEYELRAVARDAGDRVDPAPEVRRFAYKDLVAPDAVAGLSAQVDGGEVTLTWTPVGDADLAGYHVERVRDGGASLRLTLDPVAAATYVDAGAPDAELSYTVIAADVFGNEAEPSPPAAASVYTPQLDALESPTPELAVSVGGSAVTAGGEPVAAASVTVTVSHAADGTTSEAPGTTDAAGAFTVDAVPLLDGVNEISVVVTDELGDRSKAALASVLSTPPPSAPTGLAGFADGPDVHLSWNANPEPDVIGYRVLSERFPGPGPIAAEEMTATASTRQDIAGQALDPAYSLYWLPQVTAETPFVGQWWAATWSTPRAVSSVYVAWQLWFSVVDYDVQILVEDQWVTAGEVRDFYSSARDVDLPLTLATGVRIVLLREYSGYYFPPRLTQVKVQAEPLLTEPAWTDAGPGDGAFTYQVVAVNDVFQESPPSESVTVEVGDATPPDPVTLTATVDGSDVHLSWTASPAPDLDRYELYVSDLSWPLLEGLATELTDFSLANGTYTYYVLAYDTVGNFSRSEDAVATVAIEPPGAPTGLAVTALPQGRALELSWQPPGEPLPFAYRVARSEEPGGPYATVGSLSATTFVNSGLFDGRTYYYVVYARDFLGNESAPSDEASGTPQKVLSPPAIGYPARGGQTVLRDSPTLRWVSGLAGPSQQVTVKRDGEEVGTDSTEPSQRKSIVSSFSGPVFPAPDGRWGWADGFFNNLYDFELKTETTINNVPSGAQWMPSSDRLIYGLYDSQTGTADLVAYRVEDGTVETLHSTPFSNISTALPSVDGGQLALVARNADATLQGLFVFDRRNLELRHLVDANPSAIDHTALVWTPDGSRIAYLSAGRLELVDTADGTVETIAEGLPSGAGIDVSPSGHALAYESFGTAGKKQIWLHTFADGLSQQLTDAFADHREPRWLPDGDLVYARDRHDLYRLDPETGDTELLYFFGFWTESLEVARSGHILAGDGGKMVRITLAGQFEVRDVDLLPGDNLLTAFTEESKATSADSEAVTVRLPPPARPDLEIVPPLLLAPAYPVSGEPTAVQVTVRNAATAAAGATELELTLVRTDGTSIAAGTSQVVALVPGAETTVSSFVTFTGAGVHTLVAVVDPRNLVPESAEDNNRAERPLLLLGGAAPAVFVRTGAAGYDAGEDVALTVDAVNAGAAAVDGRLEVVIEDAGGFLVTALPAVDPLALAPGVAAVFAPSWNTGTTFAGSYRARARLVGGEGAVLAEAAAGFEIRSSARVEAAVETDRTQYDEGDTVRLTATVSYVSGNRVLAGAAAHLRVAGPTGETVAEWRRPLGELLPASTGDVSLDWPSAGAPAAFYDAELEIYAGDDLLVSATASFALGNVGPARLVATKIDTADADGDGAEGPGDTLRYEIAVSNVGGEVATEVKLTDLLPQHTAAVPGSLVTSHGSALSEDPVEVEIGVLGPGETATVTFDVTIDEVLPEGVTEIVNQGTVTSAEAPAALTDDPDLGGDADPTVTAVGGAPELVAEKTWTLAGDGDGDGVPSPGDVLAYAVVLRNVGSGAATGVGFADEVPAHTALVPGSVTASAGTVDSEDPVLVVVDELAAGAEVTIGFEVTVDAPITAGVTEVSNQGLAISDQLDDVATDDPAAGGAADPTVTPIAAAPVLAVEKTATLFTDPGGDGLASPGDELLYRVEVTNAGNTAATGVVLRDSIGAHLAIVPGSVQTSQGTVAGEAPVEAELGELAVGDPAVVTFRVTIDAPLPIDVLEVTNQAAVDSAELATVLSDDPATPETGDATATEVYVTPDVSVDDVTAEETAGTAVVTVTLSEPSNRPVTVSYATADGTASAGLDYEAAAGDLEIAAGETTVEIAVTVTDDALDEDDKAFTVTLSGAGGGVLVDGEATVTIADDDPPPNLAIGDVVVGEGEASALFPLLLSGASGWEITFAYASADGSAVAGSDYQAVAGTVTIPAGALATQVAVSVNGDVVDELDETFELHLSEPSHVVLTDPLGEALIVDDDEALITIDDVEVDEGDAEAIFTVGLATLADREILVSYATVAESAAAGADYEAAAGTLTFPPGEVTAELGVPILDDAILEEGDKTFRIELSNAVNTTIEDGVGICTIHDDELCPGPELLLNPGAEERVKDGVIPAWTPLEDGDWQVLWSDPEPYEGEAYFFAGAAELGELYQDVDVAAYAARIAAGGQLFAFTGRVRTRDEVPPDVARVVVEYRDAANGVVLDAFDSGEIASPYEWQEVQDVRAAPVGTGWIRVRLLATRFTDAWNDGYFDALTLASRRAPTVTINDVTVYEGTESSADAVFTVALACAYEHEVRGTFATADATALAGEDYLATAGAFTFLAGATSFEIRVGVVADEEDEAPVESFTVELGDLTSAGDPVLLDASGRGDIRNDDFCPHSPGFWKNHREDWVAEELLIGGVWYDDAGMMDLLRYGGPDAASRLAHHLVATHLNLARGSDPFILPAVEAADAFLAVYPPESDPRGEDREEANRVKDLLDDYNNIPCEDDDGGGGGGGNGNGNGNGNGGKP